MAFVKFVALLSCDHVIGGIFNPAHPDQRPDSEGITWCPTCKEGRHIMGVVTDEPVRGSDGKR